MFTSSTAQENYSVEVTPVQDAKLRYVIGNDVTLVLVYLASQT